MHLFIEGDISNLQAMIIEIVFGVLFAIIFAIGLHKISKPSLDILPVDDAAGRGQKFVHVEVHNKPRRLLFRETAINCQSEVTFEDANNPANRITLSTKWASRPNPISPAIDPQSRSMVYLADETKIHDALHEDIPAGTRRSLDIAVKFDGDQECYAHTPMNFFDPNHRPVDYRLPRTRYIVKVGVRSENGASFERYFILENIGTNSAGLTLRAT